MLATFIVEFGLAFYVLYSYRMTMVGKLVTATLLLLGTFQLAEYMICGGLGFTHIEWARLGYLAITFMPPVGLHLVLSIANVRSRPLLAAAYGTATAYALYFATAGSALTGTVCTANYAVFEVSSIGSIIFAAYYYGWLLTACGIAAYWARRKRGKSKALAWMIAGYSVFVIPTTLANIINPATIAGIPSIMCGFAVLLAIILVGKVLPLAHVPLKKKVAARKVRTS